MNKPLLPKYHILNACELEDSCCSICYELQPEIVRCSGPCRQIFCYRCATHLKVKLKECPNRCSKPFRIERLPSLKTQYRCPFNAQLCPQVIVGIDQYRLHMRNCKQISQSFRQQCKRNNLFVCPKSHKLYFLNQETFSKLYKDCSYFDITPGQLCHLCATQTICSSICIDCSTPDKKCVFCHQCRVLPCTKTKCPVGHAFVRVEQAEEKSICDFCGLVNSVLGNAVYTDSKCGFDVCEECHEKLPNAHPLVPFNEVEMGEFNFKCRLAEFHKKISL